MSSEKSRKIIIVVFIAFAGLAALAAVLSWLGYLPNFFRGREAVIGEDVNLITSEEAFRIALPDAKLWDADAKLAQIEAKGEVSLKSGKSASWILLFSSSAKENKGYEIAVSNRAVSSKKETVSRRTGADLPENGFIGENEAINRLRQIPGYENAKIQSIELIPSVDGKSWFYGIKTDKGVITLPASG